MQAKGQQKFEIEESQEDKKYRELKTRPYTDIWGIQVDKEKFKYIQRECSAWSYGSGGVVGGNWMMAWSA